MAIQKLKDYILECQKKRIHPNKIKKLLLKAGWALYEVEEAFNEVADKKKKPSSIKKISFLVIALLVIIGLLLILHHPKPQNVKACEGSIDCLIAAAERCIPATGVTEVHLDAMNISVIEGIMVRVLGGEKCKVEFSELYSTLTPETKQRLLDGQLTEEHINEAQKIVAMDIPHNIICQMPPEHLVGLLKRWQQGGASLFDLGTENCTNRDECHLATLTPYVDLPLKGQTQLKVNGFEGSSQDVHWKSGDPRIVMIENPQGATAIITAKSKGTGRVTVTDTSSNCTVSVVVEVI